MSVLEKWLCDCKFTLGIIEDRKVLRIKRKDLYVSIEGGDVTEVCPRCGKINVMKNETAAEQSVSTPSNSV